MQRRRDQQTFLQPNNDDVWEDLRMKQVGEVFCGLRFGARNVPRD